MVVAVVVVVACFVCNLGLFSLIKRAVLALAGALTWQAVAMIMP
jgi:hypothetical protein